MQEAEEKQQRFMAKLPGIRRWREALLAETRKSCSVTTLGGRRRYFRHLASTDMRALLLFCHLVWNSMLLHIQSALCNCINYLRDSLEADW